MPCFSELKHDAKVHHGLMAFNTGMERPLLNIQQQVMRSEDSPLTIAQRELIAAYVSALNECAYCRGAHTVTAMEFGVEKGVVEALLKNIESAPVDDNLKQVFKYVLKLTIDLQHMEQADADAVFEAGWSSRARYDAISVQGNRLTGYCRMTVSMQVSCDAADRRFCGRLILPGARRNRFNAG